MTRWIYVLAATTCSALSAPAWGQSPSAEANPSAIEYASVDAALAALRSKEGVKFSKNDDWIVASELDGTHWSFAPTHHPAYPAVGRRRLHQQGETFFVVTNILCQARKPACDKLRDDYQLLDRRMNEAIRAKK